MSNAKSKWFILVSISAICLWTCSYHAQVTSEEIAKLRKSATAPHFDLFISREHFLDCQVIPKAKVFRNVKGLKEQIKIECPLREMNAISKTKTETVEELIEQISIWVPIMYSKRFSVTPKCIIVLETKINKDGMAEVRFGVAMECIPKSHVTEIIYI